MTLSPAAVLRLRLSERLLRCRFWKSEPWRGPPGASPCSSPSGVSILMTLAPQSASWRTQVGPERTRVRSSTVKRERARDAGLNGMVSPEERECRRGAVRLEPSQPPRLSPPAQHQRVEPPRDLEEAGAGRGVERRQRMSHVIRGDDAA